MKKKETQIIKLKDYVNQTKVAEYINLSTAEKLELATKDYHGGTMFLEKNLSKLPKKALKRLLMSAVQLPEDGMKVEFTSDLEIYCFGVIQRVLKAKWGLVLHGIKQTKKYENMVQERIMAEEAKKNEYKKEKNNE